MRILLTGATGFIGGVFGPLAQAAGHEVVALVRSASSSAAATQRGFQPVSGSLEDAPSLATALASSRADAVVHLAAVIATTRSTETVDRVNRVGTDNLLAATVAAGVRRFVFTSTVVTGDAHGRLLHEAEPLPVDTPYGRAKQASENAILALGSAGRLEPVILRPSHVYGPGGWFSDLVRDIRTGRFMTPGKGDNLWDMVHVEDVAQALLLATTAPRPSALYHVVDDTPVTMGAVVAAIAARLGKSPPWHVPVWLARWVAGRNAIAAAVRSARSSNEKLKGELGFVPRHPVSLASIPGVVDAIVGALA